MVVGKEVTAFIEVEHSAGIAPQRYGLLFVVPYLAPYLYDILLAVGDIVKDHIVGILVISQTDNCLRAATDRLLLVSLVV